MSETAVPMRHGVIFVLLMLAGWLAASFVVAQIIRAAPPELVADAAACLECATTGYVPCSAAPKNCPLCSASCCRDGDDKCCCIHIDRCTCVPPPTRGPG